MKLQFISDLHENFIKIYPRAENIVLIGDIASPFNPEYEHYLSYLSNLFMRVFVVMGNHEFYHSVFTEAEEQMEKICNKFVNVFLLNNKSFFIDGILLVGSTLWSDIDEKSFNFLNCREYIKMNKRRKMTIQDYKHHHQRAVDFIIKEVNKGFPTIVITHYAPQHEMNGKRINSPYTSGFSSDLSFINNKNIIAWLSGHTHNCMTLYKNGITYSSNCLGTELNRNFNPNKIIEIA